MLFAYADRITSSSSIYYATSAGGSNELGFSALLTGYYDGREYNYLGQGAYFWLSDKSDNKVGNIFILSDKHGNSWQTYDSGMAVRCAKDAI